MYLSINDNLHSFHRTIFGEYVMYLLLRRENRQSKHTETSRGARIVAITDMSASGRHRAARVRPIYVSIAGIPRSRIRTRPTTRVTTTAIRGTAAATAATAMGDVCILAAAI